MTNLDLVFKKSSFNFILLHGLKKDDLTVNFIICQKFKSYEEKKIDRDESTIISDFYVLKTIAQLHHAYPNFSFEVRNYVDNTILIGF